MKSFVNVIALGLLLLSQVARAADAPEGGLDRALARRAESIVHLLALDAPTAARLRALDAVWRTAWEAIGRDDTAWKAALTRQAALPHPDYGEIARLHELILSSAGRAAAIQVELLHGYRDLLGLPRFTKLMLSWDQLRS